jgi:tetratricopeptide (TPR) repeat protein
MLTTKNGLGRFAALLAAVILAGCTPAGPRALFKGKQLLEQGRYAEAAARLETATTLMSTNAQAWNYLGLACHYLGRWEEARKAYQTASTIDPSLIEAKYNLGWLLLASNKVDDAKSQFTTYTLQREKSVEGLFLLGLCQLRARETASDLRARLRETGAAERSFAEVLQLDPKHARAWNALGVVRTYQGQYGEAMKFFGAAMYYSPGFTPAVLNRAILAQVYQHDSRLALECYREYLARAPGCENAEEIERLVRELEREQSAPAGGGASNIVARAQSHSTTNAVRNRMESPVPVVKKPSATNISLEAETNRPAKSAPGPRYAYRVDVRLAPGNRSEAQKAFAAGLQAQQGRHLQEALTSYRQAVEQDPAFFEAQFNLGVVAAELGNVKQALAAYENALLLKFDSLDARYNFALALQRANFLADAAAELEKLLGSSPNEVRAHLAAANLYAYFLHQPAKARVHYQKVLETDPHNSQVGAIKKWLADNP